MVLLTIEPKSRPTFTHTALHSLIAYASHPPCRFRPRGESGHVPVPATKFRKAKLA